MPFAAVGAFTHPFWGLVTARLAGKYSFQWFFMHVQPCRIDSRIKRMARTGKDFRAGRIAGASFGKSADTAAKIYPTIYLAVID